jgi:hypothetical protein
METFMSYISSLMPTRSTRGPGVSTALLLAWVAAVIALGAPAFKTGVFDAMSTDDAMRLVEVRDLIGGQGWFDLVQYRLDPPGVSMHWSRLVDAPLALLIVCLKPLVGQYSAEAIVLVVWPSLLWAAALLLIASIVGGWSDAAHREKAQLAAIVLASLSIPALVHFRAGAIDHHNGQIVLLLAFLLSVSQIEKNVLMPFLAGAAASASLAIGIEMLPAIAVACLAVTGLLIWNGHQVARNAAIFGAALAGSSLLLTVSLLPIHSLSAQVCDSNGGPLLLLTVGGGVGLLMIASVARVVPSFVMRLLTGLAAAVVVLGAFVWLFPSCVASPYAGVDPLIAQFWLGRVAESLSLSAMVQLQPQKVAAFYGFPIVTIGVCLAMIASCAPYARFRWIVAALALAALFSVSVWELRGAAAANIVAAPFFVLGIVHLWPSRLQGHKLLLASMIASPASFAFLGLATWPIIHQQLVQRAGLAAPDADASCTTMSSVAALSRLPAGNVMAPIDTGPAILAATSHSVFAAPYHRNDDGNLAMLKTMLAAPDAAREMFINRSVDYVIICPAAPDQADFEKMAPDGLAARLNRGDAPGFLERVTVNGSAKFSVWHVRQPHPE